MLRCPFPFCPRARSGGHFACRGHWWRMPRECQQEALDLMRKMDASEMSPQKYREMRDDIVARCPGAFLPAPLLFE